MANIGVTIDGNSYSSFAEELTRENHLCVPGHVFSLRLAANAPTASLQPWKPIVLTEQGVTVLTGFLERIEFNRPPTHIVVRGKDTWKKASDWFIPENIFSAGESVGYWADYLCGLVGLSYTILTSGSTNAVKPDLPLGLKHVSEALLAVCAFAQWCIRVNPSGIVEFRSTAPPTSFDYTLTQAVEIEKDENDESTRNVVKVFGFNSGSSSVSGAALYKESRSVPGISGERIMVFGSPDIDTYDKARDLGKAALNQFADLERRTSLKILGNANIQVGQSAKYFTSSGSTGPAIGLITDLHSRMTTGTYDETVTVGRRCFRLPAFGARGVYTSPPTSGSSLGYVSDVDGLIAYWKLEETSVSPNTGARIDSSPNARHLTGAFGHADSSVGKIGIAAKWDDSPFYWLGRSASQTDALAFLYHTRTVALWFMLSDKSVNRCLIGRQYFSFLFYYLEWGIDYKVSTDRLRFVAGVTGTPLEEVGSPALDQWYFMTIIQDTLAGNITIRVNMGTPQVLSGNAGADVDGSFQIGARNLGIGVYDFWFGRVDEVGVWGRVLTEEEQADLYNGGAGRSWPFN